jgi:hypothetical protein
MPPAREGLRAAWSPFNQGRCQAVGGPERYTAHVTLSNWALGSAITARTALQRSSPKPIPDVLDCPGKLPRPSILLLPTPPCASDKGPPDVTDVPPHPYPYSAVRTDRLAKGLP